MKKGFTLVELLAVIVILAIILVIAVPGISGLIQSSTRGAFTSDAKMVLKAVEYKLLEDNSFDPSTVNETNVNTLLNLDNSNYQTLTVKKINDTYHVTIVGKNKWANLTASGTQSTARVDDTVTTFSNGANKPVLVTGMTPIKWNGSTWVDTTESDSSWYNYDTTNKIWANARTADGSMWVWIPRYIYRISSGWHTATAGTIDVQFTKGVDDNWNKAVIGNIDVGETSNASNNKWTNEPAFTFGDTELTGFWVAKFEATASEGVANGYTSDSSCPITGDDTTTKTIKIVPNVTSWRCIRPGSAFAVSRNMETNNVYGWGTSGVGIDTHLMKNDEWGAVAYLTQSTYGKNAEVWINPADTFTTGCAGTSVSSAITTGCTNAYSTANGQQASTTGNIYGIYDMSGGAWEFIAAYVDCDSTSLTNNGSNILSAAAKYKELYAEGATHDGLSNFNMSINTKGNAMYEVSDSYIQWYNDDHFMSSETIPWSRRSGNLKSGASAGIFLLEPAYGYPESYGGFRPTLLVGQGL